MSKPKLTEREVAEAGAKLWHALVQHFIEHDHFDLDGHDFQEMAVEAGLMRWDTYRPDEHGEIDHVEEGDRIWLYTDLGAAMTTAWLQKLTGT